MTIGIRYFRYAPLLALLLVVASIGCTSEEPVVAPKAVSQGQRVTLVEETEDFALVEFADGNQGYVPLGLIKQRNTAQKSDGEVYTHEVLRDTPISETLPEANKIALPVARSHSAIDAEQKTLNKLFIGETTGKEVIAPGNVHYFVVDKNTGERCWQTFECVNPDCPGEKKNGRGRYVFILVTENLNQEEPVIECDACLALRNLNSETPVDLTEWGSLVLPYHLPETLRRRAQLDKERRRFVEERRQRLRKKHKNAK